MTFKDIVQTLKFRYWIWAIFDRFFRYWKLKSSPHVPKSREKLDDGNSKRFEFSEISAKNLECHTSLTSGDIIIDRKWRHHKLFDFHITRGIQRISNVMNQLIMTLSDPIGRKFWKFVSQKIFWSHANPTCHSRVIWITNRISDVILDSWKTLICN